MSEHLVCALVDARTLVDALMPISYSSVAQGAREKERKKEKEKERERERDRDKEKLKCRCTCVCGRYVCVCGRVGVGE